MTALITLDYLGERFDVQVLAIEEKKAPQEEPSAVASTANDVQVLADEEEQMSQEEPSVLTANDGEVLADEDEKMSQEEANAVNSTTTDNHEPTIEVQSDAQDEEDEEGNDGELVLKTVGQLRKFIGDKFQIEPATAKFIYQAKLIGTKDEERLSKFGFKDEDVIKVMDYAGVDPGFANLCIYEQTNFVQLTEAFERNGQELDLLGRNSIEGEDREELVKKTEKLLRFFSISAEKHLEALDALEIYSDETPADQKTKNREKRKKLVNSVLTLLNSNDKYLHQLDNYKFKAEHSDEGKISIDSST